ncbi:spore germination protein [Paenibacillus alkaliterrae]|uniref:GerAB/ArcD/ProY family transporter n=1 Tax=Paenibacillus alkaliterrae TaxID=320909 RepID=UPI001F3F7FFA|nr:endospore germination permease [Paenibacillus alkaliterrae]MCF2937953.1 spore germination protein [Paenibacillus alkaliterrae]
MNKQEWISSKQMAALFFAFMTGSSIINIPAPLAGAAKNGAWLSPLLANAMAMLLLACMLYLHRRYPGMTFIDYSRKIIGNWLTLLLSIPLLILVMLDLSYIVLDIGGFFASSMMQATPPVVIHFLVLLTAALTVRGGIEVMARLFSMLIPVMLLAVMIILIFVLPYYHPESLLPLFPGGIKPVVHGAYLAFGFPYAETVLFAMILPLARQEKENPLGKWMVAALLINGIALFLSILSSIMVLGPLAGEAKYSLFQLARLIQVQNIIERVESIIGIALIVGSLMKTTIMLFIFTVIVSKVLKSHDEKIFVFPVTLFALLLTLTMFNHEVEFFEAVYVVWPLFITMAAVVPFMLVTLVAFFKEESLKPGDDSGKV